MTHLGGAMVQQTCRCEPCYGLTDQKTGDVRNETDGMRVEVIEMLCVETINPTL